MSSGKLLWYGVVAVFAIVLLYAVLYAIASKTGHIHPRKTEVPLVDNRPAEVALQK